MTTRQKVAWGTRCQQSIGRNMKTKEQLEAELDQKLAEGKITVDEAEHEYQNFMHRDEDWREW